jgi:DNA polymerase
MGMVHALEFQIDAGVNVFLEAEPVNRFESHMSTQTLAPEPRPQHQPTPQPGPQPDPKLTVQPVSAPVIEPQSQNDDMPSYDLTKARPVAPAVLREKTADAGDISAAEHVAEQADTLDALKQAMEAFEGCALKRAAKNTVFSDGNPASKIMLVGEAPGRDEDREGKPFIGRSGKLLDKMFAAIGLNRNDIYITNLVPWRPTGNRTPTPDETALCRPFLLRHIELIQPDILVLVGGVSAKEMLDSTLGITKLRGSWQDINIKGRDIPALPILHPAYLLRNPARKAETWQDLCSLQKKLSNTLSSEAANLDGTD